MDDNYPIQPTPQPASPPNTDINQAGQVNDQNNQPPTSPSQLTGESGYTQNPQPPLTTGQPTAQTPATDPYPQNQPPYQDPIANAAQDNPAVANNTGSLTDDSQFSTYEFPTAHRAQPTNPPAETHPQATPVPSMPQVRAPTPAVPEPQPDTSTTPEPAQPFAQPVQPPVDTPTSADQPTQYPAGQSPQPIESAPQQPATPPALPANQAAAMPADDERSKEQFLGTLSTTRALSQDATATSTAKRLPIQLNKLRQDLSQKAKLFNKADLKKRLKPLISASIVSLLIYGLFNSQILLGQIQYLISPGGNADTPAVIDASQVVGDKPEIIIPKINLRVPVVYDVKTFDESAVQKGLERGVVHYGTTAVPGQKGNNVIVGHSSNNWWDSGKYKFAFVLLSKLEEGDNFYLHYEGIRYTYEVTNKKIIEANDVQILNQRVSQPLTTLITCDPPGTSWRRLAVQARQIDPDPAQAATAGNLQSPQSGTTLPSDGQSIFEKIRSWF